MIIYTICLFIRIKNLWKIQQF